MKKIYVAADYMLAGQVKSLLETNQIECIMKNDSLTGGIGELPPTECWPEIWIQEEQDETLANKLITSYISGQTTQGAPWQCACGESIEGQFSQCWQCGHIN